MNYFNILKLFYNMFKKTLLDLFNIKKHYKYFLYYNNYSYLKFVCILSFYFSSTQL